MDYFVCFHGGGSVHKNIFDSESLKPNVKAHRFRMTSLSVQKFIDEDFGSG